MKKDSPLRISISSSFDIDHFGNADGDWPHKIDCEYVEVYAFMETCLKATFPSGAKGATALKALAATRNKRSEVKRVASIINAHFKGIKIVAITSYLPEILAPAKSPTWKLARVALKFLISVLAELRDTYKHPCSTLVMVGGSRYDGMWATVYRDVKEGHESKGEKVLVVNTLTKEAAIDRLLARLDGVAKSAKKHGVYLAISLEPGPLFAIGDWDSLALFCDKIESSSEAIKSNVGLNLDIPHWAFLSNITVQKIEAHPNVKKRIVHAQISDHDRGHCSDAVPGAFHDDDEFFPWLSLLKKLAANVATPNRKDLPFSGFISCEHEMACKTQTIIRSMGKLKRLISRCK